MDHWRLQIHEGVMSCWKYSFNLLIGISKEDKFAVREFFFV